VSPLSCGLVTIMSDEDCYPGFDGVQKNGGVEVMERVVWIQRLQKSVLVLSLPAFRLDLRESTEINDPTRLEE
jgi:hypothetical protein